MLFSVAEVGSGWSGWCSKCGAAASRSECFFPGPGGADFQDALAGGDAPDPERVRAGFPQVRIVVEAEEVGPGGEVGGDAPATVDLPGHMGGPAGPWPWRRGRLRFPRRRARGAQCRCTAGGDCRDAGDPGVRDVGAGDGVLPAGFLLVVRQVPQVAAGRLHWWATSRRPPGQFPARLIRSVVFATPLSSSSPPPWAMPGFHATFGACLMATSSAAVILHLQAKSTIRRAADRDSRCFTSSWLAPAPQTRARIFRRNGAGTCRRPRPAPPYVSERVRSRLAGHEEHGQALAGIGEPGAQRVEAFQVGAAPSLSELTVTRGVHVDDQPAGQGLPCDDEPREPGGHALDRVPHMRAGFRASTGDLVQRGRCRSQVRGAPHRRLMTLGASPRTGARCASAAMSLMPGGPSAIAVAIETSTTPRSKAGDCPVFRSAALRCLVVPPGRRPCGAGPRRRGRPARLLLR